MTDMTTSSRLERLRGRWSGLSDHQQVGTCLVGVGSLFGSWLLFWPVPTQVEGRGVLIYPDNAGLLNARAGGQVLSINTEVGQTVRKGQVLMTQYLPVLERKLDQQKGNLRQLIRQNDELDQRDALRIRTARLALDTALAKLDEDQKRLARLQSTYSSNIRALWRVDVSE